MEKHRHHQQPQHYLKGFSASSTNLYQKTPDIWVYRAGRAFTDGINPELCSVKDIGYGRDFYAFARDDRSIDYNKYEDILMSAFEQPAHSVLDKIRSRQEISSSEQHIFSRYIGSMITRGLWWRSVGNTALSEAVDELSSDLLSSIPQEDKKCSIQKIIAEQANAISEGEWKNEGMIRNAERLSAILNEMFWYFVVAANGMFYFTSDNPVFYYELDKPLAELMFPLSSEIALALSWHRSLNARWQRIGKRFWEADDTTVEHARRIVCSTAHEEIYCSRKAEWIVQFFNGIATEGRDHRLKL